MQQLSQKIFDNSTLPFAISWTAAVLLMNVYPGELIVHRGQHTNHKPALLWRQCRAQIYQSQCCLPWISELVPTVAGPLKGQSSPRQCWPADRLQMYRRWRPVPRWSPINCSDRRWSHEKRYPRTERTKVSTRLFCHLERFLLKILQGKTVQIDLHHSNIYIKNFQKCMKVPWED